MVEPRCSKAAIGRAKSVVRRSSRRHGMATSRAVLVRSERTPGSPRADSIAV